MSVFERQQLSELALSSFAPHSQECILRLRQHSREECDISLHPKKRLAAVLVLLYESAGQLRVLLTTRSKALRSHPGQTALPGGKVDEEDDGFEGTAYREANEEIALPLNHPSVQTLCLLQPFVSQSFLLVTPVVALLSPSSPTTETPRDPAHIHVHPVLTSLRASPSEVDNIFSFPLEVLLDPGNDLHLQERLVDKGVEDWPYDEDYYNFTDREIPNVADSLYRMHRFRSYASPVKGLTADILIQVAEIAYARSPSYERWASGQARDYAAIERLIKEAGDKGRIKGTADSQRGSKSTVQNDLLREANVDTSHNTRQSVTAHGATLEASTYY